MYNIKEAVIVEGKYDKQRILSFADALVIETTGFDVFKNEETKRFIIEAANNQGIVILTDSDKAGLKIRNFIKTFVPEEMIKNAYIPEVKGRERRKTSPSAEGNLGVEGIEPDLIISALVNAGCCINGEMCKKRGGVTKVMLYEDGFFGREDSLSMRLKLCKTLGLPSKISVNSLLKAINSFCDTEEYRKIAETLANKSKPE